MFSPSHDGYVSTKPGADVWNAAVRIEHLQQALRHLSARLGVSVLVDPWEALGVDTPVNFTTVAQRWRLAWNRAHPHCPVQVGLVVGGDNAGFSQVAEPEMPVWVIQRPGWAMPELPAHAYAVAGSSPLASRQLRLAGAWPRGRAGAGTSNGCYAWRDDLAFALAPWETKLSQESLWKAGEVWRDRVIRVLARGAAPWPLFRVDVEAQKAWLARASQGRRILNLDPVTAAVGAWPLAASRRFAPAGAQIVPRWHGPRPGVDPEQVRQDLERLPPGGYWLLDDDIASGGTMQAARAAMPPHVHVRGCLSLLGALTRHRVPPVAIQDVVDLRDFLPGSQEGGLVVCFPDRSEGRLPYMAPHVNLVTRASFMPQDVLPLSIELWRAAQAFFEALPRVLRLKDGSPAFVRAMRQQGNDLELPLHAWCAQQAEVCQSQLRRVSGFTNGAANVNA